ncbi:hypothetical protein ACHAXS_014092 [Conticribra weissflogii]
MGKKSKRTKSSATTTTAAAAPPSTEEETPRRPAPALRPVRDETAEETPDDLRMEDPFEDIYEDDDDDEIEYEDVYESSGDEDEDEDDVDYPRATTTTTTDEQQRPRLPPDNPKTTIKSWNPFLASNSASTPLEMDETAYKMHHALTPEWPSLSLDIVPDEHLGGNRTRFPHTVTMVVGSQADKRSSNKLTVLRMSDLCRIPGSGREKTEKELDDEMLGEEWKHDDDDDEEDSSDEDEEEDEDLDPVLEHYSFPHPTGGINRLRVCPHNRDIVACWGDNGTVSLYDIGGALDVLDRSSAGADRRGRHSSDPVRKMKKDPFFVYSGHATEGYAVDWSRVAPGRLATADCRGNIHVWDATHPVLPRDIAAEYEKKKKTTTTMHDPWSTSSFVVKPTYAAHGENLDNPSVEDLQWSPNEATVLASGECGGVVRIYDVRCPGKAMISNKIHGGGADVNVIAWNRLVSNLLATGGDDGAFSVWDLRHFQSTDPSKPPKPLARFHSHRTPITSLEWHPTDESMIAVSDDHGTYIYDLSIEEDDPDNDRVENDANGGGVEGEIPPQLLFVHSGSEMTKEVHWHPQIPSCVATTSLSGFSVFIPSNL